MANRKGLKQKDIDRLAILYFKHPGDITPDEVIEKEKLEARLAQYGRFSK